MEHEPLPKKQLRYSTFKEYDLDAMKE